MRSGRDFSQRSEWVPEPGGGAGRPPLRVILLDDLSHGLSVQASVTQPEQDNEVQRIQFQGDVDGGTFRLTFDGQTTGDLDHDISAADLQTALEALSNIDPDDIEVWAYEGLYVVEFKGQYEEEDVALMTATNDLTGDSPNVIVIANTIWTDSGRTVEVWGMIPHGTPTPMVKGGVALVQHYPGLGYGVHAMEPRDFETDPYGSY